MQSVERRHLQGPLLINENQKEKPKTQSEHLARVPALPFEPGNLHFQVAHVVGVLTHVLFGIRPILRIALLPFLFLLLPVSLLPLV